VTPAEFLADARARGLVVNVGPAAQLPTVAPAGTPDDVAGLVAQLVAAGFPEPVAEHRFHPTRRWRFDLAWPAQMVAFEREGLGGGRHQRHHGYTADCRKYSEAAVIGWCVVRATAKQIRDGTAIGLLTRALAARGCEK
jgi:hypothetical protein